MTEEEAINEDNFISGIENKMPSVLSLRTALASIYRNNVPKVIVIKIGGLLPKVQLSVVNLVIDYLKKVCQSQNIDTTINQQREVPIYPTVYFEEAHNYMEAQVINELLPIIRHVGMNVFFITNTPGALPDSVFRLLDNLIMTQLLNKRDIDQVKNCGLADADTIEGFANSLPTHHALVLSADKGITNKFPLMVNIRNFGLPTSGETRYMWQKLEEVSRKNLE
jgi:hypothetical protein